MKKDCTWNLCGAVGIASACANMQGEVKCKIILSFLDSKAAGRICARFWSNKIHGWDSKAAKLMHVQDSKAAKLMHA